MSAPGDSVALAVQLGTAADRREFLLRHLRAVVPGAARSVAFSDDGPGQLELMLGGAEPAALSAWLGAVASSGLVRSVAARRRADQRSDGHFEHEAQRQAFLEGQYRWSAVALDLLEAHPTGLPDERTMAELGRVHEHGGDATASMRWHAQWLGALDGRCPWPDRADGIDAVVARLAHIHWLRLREGRRDDVAEITALETLISAAGREP